MRRLCVFYLMTVWALFGQDTTLDSRSALNRGVAAFKAAQYTDAVAAFEQAVKLDPANVNARLYLGTAYMTQWIPGADTPENLALASHAETAFRAALDIDPKDRTAIASLASIYFNKGKALNASDPRRAQTLDDAESWYGKLIEAGVEDKTAYYSLGVIQWERFYPELMNARRLLNMKPEDPGPLRDSSLRADLRNRLGRNVERGIASLKHAIEIDPLYSDAMAYANLLYRERADYAETQAEYQRDIATADDYVSRALAARKQVAESGGMMSANVQVAPPPPPAAPGPPPGVERIRIGGNVQAAKLVQKITPVYPPMAKQARIQGTVRFSVILDVDGKVKNLQLVSGHPLLVPAAVDAVKNWVYETTLLNGKAVEVITQVDVNFTLSN